MSMSYLQLSEMNSAMDNELTEIYSENWHQKDMIVFLKEESTKLQAVIEALKLQLKQRGYH